MPSRAVDAIVYLLLLKLVISFNDAFFAVILLEPSWKGGELEEIDGRQASCVERDGSVDDLDSCA